MTYEDLILGFMTPGSTYTTQSITESLFKCRKGDARYNNYVEDVGKDMQRLKRQKIVIGTRVDTGHGYSINEWRLAE